MADRSAMDKLAVLGLTLITVAIAGCTNEPQGVRIINGAAPAQASKTPEPIHDLTAPEITKVLVGKTFQYTRKGSSGFVVYNGDGTLRAQDDQKGPSVGKWTVNGNQYCESYSVAQPMECGVFKSTGNAYFAANSRIEEMKI